MSDEKRSAGEIVAEPSRPDGAGWTLLTLACALAVLGFYAWTIQSSRAELAIRGQRTDYYNLLVDGFEDGHLYMKAEVDPALAAMTEEQRKRGFTAPFLLDASLYQNRYYLYFGVVPAVLLHWPVSAASGQDLPVGAAVLLSASLALVFSYLWWREVRRQLLPRLGARADGLVALALGWGTAVPAVLRRPLFYEEATLLGWAFGALMLWALARAARSDRRWAAWLVTAGIAYGLAVGSRANLAPAGGVALVAGFIWVSWARGRRLGAAGFFAALGVVPIAAGLAGYNYARFGQITEFGHTYQLGLKPERLFRATNLAHNAGVYYTHPPQLNLYFPYVLPPREGPKPPDYIGRESAHGEWIWLVLAVGVGAATWPLWRQRRFLLLAPVALWFAGNFLVTALLGVRANRYMLDFHPALVLVALVGLGWLGLAPERWRRGAAFAAALVVGLALGFNLCASFEVHGFFRESDPAAFQRLARGADGALFRLAPWVFREVGDKELTVRWPGRDRNLGGPFAITLVPNAEDRIWVELDGGGRGYFWFQHGEWGSASGPWFDYRPGEIARVRVSGGFLLPPSEHGWYGARDTWQRVALKRRLRILVNDQIVFDRDVSSYDLGPSLVDWRAEQIAPIRTPALQSAWIGELENRGGPLRLRLRLPQDRFGHTEPLAEMPGDVLLMTYTRPGYVRLIHDRVHAAVAHSEEFAVNYDAEQLVEVDTTLSATDDAGPGAAPTEDKVTVRWNGREVFVSPVPVAGGRLAQVKTGANEISAVGRRMFAGTLLEAPAFGALPSGRFGRADVSLDPRRDLIGLRGELMAWRGADGRRAAVIWERPEVSGPVRLGWREGEQVEWGRPLADAEAELQVWFRASWPEPGSRRLVGVRFGDTEVLRTLTDFQPGTTGARALAAARWRLNAPENLSSVDPYGGRVRFHFVLPADGLARGAPLLRLGETDHGDLIFLKPLGENRYAIALDHWAAPLREGAPMILESGRPIEFEAEIGSLTRGSAPSDRVRVNLNGVTALDVRSELYPAQPDRWEIGANSIGFSTSSPRFPGEIFPGTLTLRTR